MVAFLWSVSAQDYIFYTQNIFFSMKRFFDLSSTKFAMLVITYSVLFGD